MVGRGDKKYIIIALSAIALAPPTLIQQSIVALWRQIASKRGVVGVGVGDGVGVGCSGGGGRGQHEDDGDDDNAMTTL